jgi:hypothetical protein
MLTGEQLGENFEKVVNLINEEFTGERKERLSSLYEDWADRIATAPASTKKSYYNAFPGGYVLHVLDICKAAALLYDVWEEMVGELDFSWEELAFVALNHDLGKIGTETEDYYVPCTEEWMIKKGTVYVLNPKLQYMKVADRSLMTLSNRGVKMSDKEYLAIKLYDGLYDEANKPYFLSYSEDYELKTFLPYVIHQADLLSTKAASIKKKEVAKKVVASNVVSKFFK